MTKTVCSLIVAVSSLLLAMPVSAQTSAGTLAVTTRLPDNNAKAVNPDSHLNITFDHAPTLGSSGQVRIYDAADNKLVDTIDLSIAPTDQIYNIGGFDLHAYPVLISGNTAIIYPHHHTLAYNKTYYVQMDSGVLTDGTKPFAGFSGNTSWVFTTKAAPPPADSERLVVAADGTGDFSTVQGAIDFIPDGHAKRVTIFLRKGTYGDIVCFQNKADITFLGEDRVQTVVGYPNNDALQPNYNLQPPNSGSSYRRGVFMGFNSHGMVLTNFTIRNSAGDAGGRRTQMEAILFKEVRGQQTPNLTQFIITNMNLYSHIDTIQISGQAYLADNYVEGDNDYMWGNGPCFFIHCAFKDLANGTAFTQTRNPANQHGFSILNSTFEGAAGVTGAYLGNGSGDSEVALINCAVGTISSHGWNSNGANDMEYNTTNIADGKPYDMSGWPDWVWHLDKVKDAETIANYSNPTWVLGGWAPALAPIILSQPHPKAGSVGAGKFTLEATATGVPTPTYQWMLNGAALKDGNGVSGATTSALTVDTNTHPDIIGSYTVVATNASGAATSSPVKLSAKVAAAQTR